MAYLYSLLEHLITAVKPRARRFDIIFARCSAPADIIYMMQKGIDYFMSVFSNAMLTLDDAMLRVS